MPYISRVYVESVGYGTFGLLLRGLICGICLLPPTMLMGATLPAIARWMEATPQGVSRLGFFYGANIAGAVLGCLLAGFYLLRVYGTVTATYVAVAMNVLVALTSLALAVKNRHTVRVSDEMLLKPSGRATAIWPVYITIGLSGLCAMGAEVIWTRQLSLMLGASVYTFSIILAVFLIGLGIGSTVGAWLSRGVAHPKVALGWCQMLLSAAVLWTATMLAESLPYWPIDPSLSTSPWLSFQLDLMRCVWAVLPATCLWGASFPLALASATSPGQDLGRLAGAVYAANTLGAILGAVGFSMLVIAWVGTRDSAASDHCAVRRRRGGDVLLASLAILARAIRRFDANRCPTARFHVDNQRQAAGAWLHVGHGGPCGNRCFLGRDRSRSSTRFNRVRPISADLGRTTGLHLRGRGNERVDCRFASFPIRRATSTSAARWLRQATHATCACNGCSATYQRLSIGNRNRCSWWDAEQELRLVHSCCIPTWKGL